MEICQKQKLKTDLLLFSNIHMDNSGCEFSSPKFIQAWLQKILESYTKIKITNSCEESYINNFGKKQGLIHIHTTYKKVFKLDKKFMQKLFAILTDHNLATCASV